MEYIYNLPNLISQYLRKGKIKSPFSNGKLERFFGSIRRYILKLSPVLTEKRLNLLVKDYIIYYNQYRPHQSLPGSVPEDIYQHNRIFNIGPLRTDKNPGRKIKRIRFCEGMLNTYILKYKVASRISCLNALIKSPRYQYILIQTNLILFPIYYYHLLSLRLLYNLQIFFITKRLAKISDLCVKKFSLTRTGR